MGERTKPPLNYQEGNHGGQVEEDGLSDYEQAKLRAREDKGVAKTAENVIGEAEKIETEVNDGRRVVHSFAELMVRSNNLSIGSKVKIWDRDVVERVNDRVGKRYQKAVYRVGSYIEGYVYKIDRPYRFIFNVFGPDLNNPEGEKVMFWGGTITINNFESEWAGILDIGEDTSGHSQEYYNVRYQQALRESKEKDKKRGH